MEQAEQLQVFQRLKNSTKQIKTLLLFVKAEWTFIKDILQLHELAYDNWHKNLFKDYIKDRDCYSPEPYRVWEYYNQKCSLAQAFDIAINNEGIRDLPDPTIHMNKHELVQGYKVVEEIKAVTGKDKVVVFQPFGTYS